MNRFHLCCAVALVGVLCTGVAQGSEGVGLKAIEGRIGFVDIAEGDAGSTFLVSAFGDLGNLTPKVRLEAGIDFWTKSWDVDVCDWSWTNIGFVGDLRYDIRTNSSFHPYGFAGLAVCYQRWDWNCDYVGGIWDDVVDSYDDSSMEVGINLGAGAEFGSGEGMTPVARVGYNTNGGADYFYIQGGLRFPMGD